MKLPNVVFLFTRVYTLLEVLGYRSAEVRGCVRVVVGDDDKVDLILRDSLSATKCIFDEPN